MPTAGPEVTQPDRAASAARRRSGPLLSPSPVRPVVVSGVDLHTGCEGGPAGPSFVIERLEFQRGDVWYARHFRGLVTFLVGHSKAGKSTALEALLYPSGLLTATVMPEVRSCAYVRLGFRIAGTRWQATRSGSIPRARVSLKNLDDQDEIEHLLRA